jgi:hypothetical protein
MLLLVTDMIDAAAFCCVAQDLCTKSHVEQGA